MAVTLLKLARAGDTIVAMTDPPMLGVLAGPIAWLKALPHHKLAAGSLPRSRACRGDAVSQADVVKVIQGFRDRSLRAADCNVVIATAMAERVSTLGVKNERIQVIHNWVDDRALLPIPAHENPLRQAWGLEDKFVVGYSGNLGRVHDIDTILQASVELVDSEIVFLCIGGGAQYDALKEDDRKTRADAAFPLHALSKRN